ncbi:MAG: orotidine-5'-phosphate decarboxylase [Treponema sp.]|nr:orotidine-5'-phosphate decarboxylase [Treponema sp.]
MEFFARLESLVRAKGSCLCIGLDPRVDPAESDPFGVIVAANRRIVDATAPYTAVYKPNVAFYEAFGSAGSDALEATLESIPDDIPVLLDAKRCDIGATAEAYALSLFGRLGADAVTLSPYMGRDAVDPFLTYADRGVFLLCRTSNPGAGFLQDLAVRRGGAGRGLVHGAAASAAGSAAESETETLYLRVARECAAWSDSIGLVVAGNDLAALRAVRSVAERAWFLAPGIGAQGGKADEAFAAGARSDGMGILVVAARSVAEAPDPAAAARALRDSLEEARLRGEEARSGASSPGEATTVGTATPAGPLARQVGELKDRLVRALIDTGCFRLGDFVLKSGKRSPFYIDLRRLISDPAALALAGEAYAGLASGLDYDRIAGIPAAALPLATAASLRIGAPLVWPRMPAKEHGTGNKVEGAFEPGERLLLLDDLITTGQSKLEAAAILRGEGLVVEELAVLIERGKAGRKDMAEAGIRLHAFLHVRELFAACLRLGMIDERKRRELEDYVEAE